MAELVAESEEIDSAFKLRKKACFKAHTAMSPDVFHCVNKILLLLCQLLSE